MFKKITVAALLTVLFCVNVYAANDYKTIRINIDGASQSVLTVYGTVAEFLQERGIDLHEKDKINFPPSAKLYDGRMIEIQRSFDLEIYIDDDPVIYRIAPDSKVGNLLAEIKEMTGLDYNPGFPLTTPITPDSNLRFYSLGRKTLVETKYIEHNTEIILTDELTLGEKEVKTPGQDGVMKLTYTVFTENNKETSRILERTVTVKKPVNRVERHGIKLPLPDDPEKGYLLKLVMEATAYSLDYESTKKNPGDPGYGITKSGMAAVFGVVAVDPTVIPLGSKLYVDGYGMAIAADIGSAIKGNRIDLFFETVEEALQYGRKTIDVYVLEYPMEEIP